MTICWSVTEQCYTAAAAAAAATVDAAMYPSQRPTPPVASHPSSLLWTLGQLLVQFIAALLSCLFLYCRICVVIIMSSALANYN